jgi:hypothetical protein
LGRQSYWFRRGDLTFRVVERCRLCDRWLSILVNRVLPPLGRQGRPAGNSCHPSLYFIVCLIPPHRLAQGYGEAATIVSVKRRSYVFSASHAMPRRGVRSAPRVEPRAEWREVKGGLGRFPRCCPRSPTQAGSLCYTTPSRGGCGRAELPSGSISRYRSTLRRAR